MKKLCLIGALIFPCITYAQKFTISGYIKDQGTGENLIGASVYSTTTAQGTTANTFGFYSITLPGGVVDLRVSYVGYETKSLSLTLTRDTTMNMALADGAQLEEIVVTGTREDKIQESTRMGTIDVPIEQIKAMPALLGEVDVMKVLQLLPGVSGGSEGASGLYVRGGGPDQNLILLDGVPVYNASHLFGFFSVFNADAINRVELVKGGFPARYGGRLSSVIDISMKEGNTKKLKGEGAIGIVASRLTLEGPIGQKGNTSFIISGRRTYIDLLARPLVKQASDGDVTAGYYFYDLNGKINHKINARNHIYLSAYTGDDKASATSKYQDSDEQSQKSTKGKDDFGLSWGNISTALRWNSEITNKLFSNVTATYSRYRFFVRANSDSETHEPDTTTYSQYRTKYNSGIRDYALKVDFDYMPTPSHYIKFGGQFIQHLFTPGVLSYRNTEQPDTILGASKKTAQEFYAYVEDDFMISDKLKINAGVHASGFAVDDKFYKSLQPRVSARYLVTPELSWKASYATMTQYIHLLTNAGIGLPTDLWVPATGLVGPERSYIASTGGAYNLNNKYEFSVEGYYKEMKGVVEYKEGASYLSIESDWQTKVEQGDGRSYGAEFFLQKKTGRISGWIGYTLSWTDRQFANINEGKRFPYRYDRRHDLEIAVSYKMKKNREFSMAWVYNTGMAVSLPQSSYMGSNPYYDILHYDGRNGYRMRAYHRMDISYTTTKQTKWGERSWVIGFYNLYSRQNPFFINRENNSKGEKTFVQYSLFPIIPSISYRFKF